MYITILLSGSRSLFSLYRSQFDKIISLEFSLLSSCALCILHNASELKYMYYYCIHLFSFAFMHVRMKRELESFEQVTTPHIFTNYFVLARLRKKKKNTRVCDSMTYEIIFLNIIYVNSEAICITYVCARARV